jgi:hypothetical protein
VDVLSRRLGLLVQLAGAIAIVVGFGLWLGPAAAFLAAGVALVVLGVLIEMSPPEEREEVTISDEGAGATD